MNRRQRVMALSLALCALLIAPALFAQTTTGRIQGRVLDAESEAALPGAVISLIGPQRTEVQTTDEKGEYRFGAVPVATYDLSVSLEGYEIRSVTGIQLDPNETRVFDIRLNRSRMQETVVVQADPNVVNLRETAVKETIDARYVNRVPLTSRRFQEILSLFPGVARSEGTTTAQFNVQGGRIRENGFRLDGTTVNDFVTGTFGANIPQNAIERFELLLNGFQAEFGENNAGIANIITKSGTNEWEFFVSETYRSDGVLRSGQDELRDLDGALYDYRPETQNWLEFSVGGPIVRDKTFFYTSLQWWREDVGNPFQPKIRKGDRYYGLFKLDHIFNDRNRFQLTFNTDPSEFERVILSREYRPEANRDQTQGGYLLSLKDDHTFTDRVFWTGMLTLHHQYLTSRPSDPNAGDFVVDLTPGGTDISGSYFNDQDRSTERWRISNKVTMNLGDRREHLMKVGLDLDWLDWSGNMYNTPLYYDLRDYGSFGDIDGDGQDDWLAYRYDFPDSETKFGEAKYAAFIQDTYAPNDRWVLDFGLRMDYQTIVKDLVFSPRLGMSFDVLGDGKQKLYMNLGRFYHDIIADAGEWTNTPSFDEYLLLFSGDSGSRVPSISDSLFTAEIPLVTQTYVLDGELDTPYKDQWTLGYAIALPWDLRFEANYTEWDGSDQIVTFYNPETGVNTLGTDGRAEYRGWNFVLRKFQSERVEFMVAYTNSVARGEDYETFGFLNPTDPVLESRESRFARLRSDRTHIINASALFDIPGGWELTTIYHFATGRAFSIENNDGIVGERNEERLPSFRQWDIGVARSFEWGDDNEVKLIGQVLNLFNSFNMVEIENNIDQPGTFLEPNQPDLGRLVQFGLELRF